MPRTRVTYNGQTVRSNDYEAPIVRRALYLAEREGYRNAAEKLAEETGTHPNCQVIRHWCRAAGLHGVTGRQGDPASLALL